MLDIEQVRRDREAGTPGPFHLGEERPGPATHIRSDNRHWSLFHACYSTGCSNPERDVPISEAESNARRIARVPDLEAYALSTHDEIAALKEQVARLERETANAFEAMNVAAYEEAFQALRRSLGFTP